mmetsp:Transcript_56882/g.135356  ORF Transcript_56882/g.135356 Transcript_56882/m.135356 type:complete len:155 (-) Transcript_56882:76-540(-)
MATDPNLKQLGIKVGTVKRTLKEYEMYLQEEVDQRAKIAQMRTDKKDEADIKKQMEVLNDTLTVIPDTRQRLQKYSSELRDFIAEHYVTVEAAVIAAGDAASTAPEGDKAFEHVRDGRGYLEKAEKHLNGEKAASDTMPRGEAAAPPAVADDEV